MPKRTLSRQDIGGRRFKRSMAALGPLADCPELELQKPEATGSAARFLMGLLAVRLLKLCNQRLDFFLSLARLGNQFINRRQLLREQIDRHAA